MSKRNRNIIIGAVVVVVIAVIGVFSFGGFGGKSAKSTVTVGIMSGSKEDDQIWSVVAKNAKDDYGITLNFKHFTDYTQPNKALTNGDVDLNAFQHYAFLKDWNSKNKTNIVSIGDTVITPIHLYSTQFTNVADIPDGATIAVPNDASNESRALYLLQAAGFIKLNVSGDAIATLNNITSYVKQVTIKELDAAQTAKSLDSVAAAVINTNYAKTSNISMDKSIFAEPIDANSKQWINFIAANSKDKDNATYKKIVASYQKQNVKDEIAKLYPDGSELSAWDLKLN